MADWRGQRVWSVRPLLSVADVLPRPEIRAFMTHSPDELSQRRQRVSISNRPVPVVPYRDDLTGALDRRAGRERLTMEVERAQGPRSGLSIVVADIDGRPGLTEASAPASDDEVLSAAGASLHASLRS